MKAAAKKFWKWFEQNQKALLFINEMADEESERFHDEMDELLVKYSDKLYYEIGGYDQETNQFIVTAGGQPDYFHLAEDFVSYAPPMDSWEIIALKPPLPKGACIRLDSGEFLLDNNELWFQPFREPGDVYSLGLIIYMRLPEFIDEEDVIIDGIYQMLCLSLGERSTALDIQSIEISIVDDTPHDQGIMCLRELPGYIEYFNRERRGMPFA